MVLMLTGRLGALNRRPAHLGREPLLEVAQFHAGDRHIQEVLQRELVLDRRLGPLRWLRRRRLGLGHAVGRADVQVGHC